jgi:hypothetical protein
MNTKKEEWLALLFSVGVGVVVVIAVAAVLLWGLTLIWALIWALV